MIARIKFEAIVVDGKDKSTMQDHIDIQCPNEDTKWAKSLFSKWIASNVGLRGASGTFHPLNGYGDIKVKSISISKE